MLQIDLQKEQLDIVNSLFARYSGKRPKPDRNLDQFWATEETVLKRVMILGSINNISQKKILFLGDDDLTSVVFNLFYRAKKVSVVDIDRRNLRFLEDISRAEGFSIEFFEHDLRNPLEKKEFKDYDVVFFDPPYTPQAVNVWLARAMEATISSGSNKRRKRPEILSSKLYFMCYGYTDKSMERGFKIQKVITSLGLIIQEKARKFNRYYGAESIESSSDLYLIQPTPNVNIRQLDTERSRFYTNQRNQ